MRNLFSKDSVEILWSKATSPIEGATIKEGMRMRSWEEEKEAN
jgi:hypothetical protein